MSFVTVLEKKWHGRNDLTVQILRTELATPGAVGNKHFKLSGSLEKLNEQGCQSLLSFGGAWSNHLHALSFEAKRCGLDLVAIVRGDSGIDNRLLQSARQNGMRIVMVSRSEYRLRHNPDYCQRLCLRYGCETWLPEGGSTVQAVSGCENIIHLLKPDQHQIRSDDSSRNQVITLAVGTGATMAGVIRSTGPGQSVVGLPVVADKSVMHSIEKWLHGTESRSNNWRLTDPLEPGYAKVDTALIDFMLQFFDETGVALDPVYTGKALQHALSSEFTCQLAANTQLVFIHTGGLMGNFGFEDKFQQCAKTNIVDRYFLRLKELLAR